MIDENEQIISWTAPEFRHYDKSLTWYIITVAVVVLLVALAVFRSDVFGAISIIIIAGIVIYLSTRTPETITVELTNKGIQVGPAFHGYKGIRHFWIVDTAAHQTLNFETTSYLNRMQVIELEDQDPETIKAYLLQYLPEHDEKEETAAQRFMHRMKF